MTPDPAAPPKTGPLVSLQILRAVAAWLVAGYHYMQQVHGNVAVNPAGAFLVAHGAFGVSLFFVLSGVVMCLAVKRRAVSAGAFLKSRAQRIFPAYWCATLVVFLYHLYAGLPWTPSFLAGSLLLIPMEHPQGTGIFPMLGVGWTLTYEMLFYGIIGSLLFLRKIRFELWVAASVAAVLAVNFLCPPGTVTGDVLRSWRMREFAAGLVLGAVFPGAGSRVMLRLPVTAACLLLGLWAWQSPPVLHGQAKLLAPAAFVAFALGLEPLCAASRLARIPAYLGDISYSTYLIHTMVIAAAVVIAGVPRPGMAEALYMAVVAAVTIGLSALSYRWIERGDWSGRREWLRKLCSRVD